MKLVAFFPLLMLQCVFAANWSPSRTASSVVTMPRGGWLGGRQSASERYRESLEEQVLQLDRQLRKARDEVSQLREQRKSIKPVILSNSSDDSSENKNGDSEEKFNSLMAMIKSLQDKESILANSLQVAEEKMQAFQGLLDKAQETNDQLEERLKKELDEAQSAMNEDRSQEIETLKAMMEKRVAEAAQEARLGAEQEASSKMEQLKEELENFYKKEMQEERERSNQAVEEEKAKMRKLVKALAIREKKLAKQ